MKELKKIAYDANHSAFDGKIITELVLNDCSTDRSYMGYEFTVYLPTKEQGFLRATMEYTGATNSDMVVEQAIGSKEYSHYVTYDAELFVTYIKKFLATHIAHWDSKSAFRGEEIAVEFFNAVLDNADSYDINEIQDKEETDVECDDEDWYDYNNGYDDYRDKDDWYYYYDDDDEEDEHYKDDYEYEF